jgi:hypothetical protein
MLNDTEQHLVLDALAMAIASNKRMLTAKPQYKSMFEKIDTDLNNLVQKIKTLAQTKNK